MYQQATEQIAHGMTEVAALVEDTSRTNTHNWHHTQTFFIENRKNDMFRGMKILQTVQCLANSEIQSCCNGRLN